MDRNLLQKRKMQTLQPMAAMLTLMRMQVRQTMSKMKKKEKVQLTRVMLGASGSGKDYSDLSTRAK